MDCGVIYVAYGEKARAEAVQSIASLRLHNDLPVAVVSNKPVSGCDHIVLADGGWKGREAKLQLYDLSPFDRTLYLDADTRVHGDISGIFDILGDGWDIAMTASTCQGKAAMWHVSPPERFVTLNICTEPLSLQAGVFAFQRNERVRELFDCWYEEWQMFKQMDQAALLRALYRAPARVWILGRPWNSMPGQQEIVEHLFGRAA
jgi:hypothetical protein